MIEQEVDKRRTFAIISHPDAGKTTITEKLLLFGRAIQMAGAGVATGLLSIPLRYMHTPSEVVDLEDVEACVKLLVAFAEDLKAGETGNW